MADFWRKAVRRAGALGGKFIDYRHSLPLPWPHLSQPCIVYALGTAWNPVLWKGRRGSMNEPGLERTILTTLSPFAIWLSLSLPCLAWWNMDFTSLWGAGGICFLCSFGFGFILLINYLLKINLSDAFEDCQKNKSWRPLGIQAGMHKFLPSFLPSLLSSHPHSISC